jgi:hypothetical protein
VIQPTRLVLEGGAVVYTWQLTAGQTGAPVSLVDFADRAVQVGGTFGIGGSVTVEGSIDGLSYNTLSTPAGDPTVFASPKIASIVEVTRMIRPVAIGDGSTFMTVSLLLRRNIP